MQPKTVPTLDPARVLDALEQAVVAIAPDGEVALFSAGAELLLGLSASAALGRSACDLLARPADGEAALECARRDGVWSGDLQVHGSDGALLPVHTRLVAIRDASGEAAGWVATLTDPRAAAGVDALTGLPTRDRFADEVRRALAALPTGGALDVLVVTLDSFDAINESLGHSAGDSLMREAAARLREAAGPAGVVARQSAAQFLLLATSPGDELAAAVHAVLEAPFLLDGIEFYIGASIGISRHPEDARDADALLDHATAAMYEARDRDGCPTKRYAGRGAATPREHLSLATRLRKAVERDEFVLNYQPIVDLERMATAGPAGLASAVTSVEALMRWSDQDRGLVAPAEFMAVAEDTGLIELIGEWVFQEACRQSRAWLEAGLDMQVGINLSLRQLSQTDLVSRMLRSAARAGVGPGQVMLELREATAMTELGVHPGVHQLHAAGFGLALDEFGAGHPSVACLRELPLDQLKLDRNLVRAAMRDAQAETLLSSIITLAGRLGVPTVAVGVEHEEELRFLLDRGCRLGQGYLFARPMSPAKLSALCAGTSAALAAVQRA